MSVPVFFLIFVVWPSIIIVWASEVVIAFLVLIASVTRRYAAADWAPPRDLDTLKVTHQTKTTLIPQATAAPRRSRLSQESSLISFRFLFFNESVGPSQLTDPNRYSC